MNERIKQLAGKALDKAVPYTWHSLDHVEVEKVMKEFAELIILECLANVWYTREDTINGNVSESIKDRIKQHFEIK